MKNIILVPIHKATSSAASIDITFVYFNTVVLKGKSAQNSGSGAKIAVLSRNHAGIIH